MSLPEIKKEFLLGRLSEAYKLVNSSDLDEYQKNIIYSDILIQKGEYENALNLAESSLQEALKKNDLKLEGKSREKKALALWWSGRYDEALIFLAETEQKLLEIKNQSPSTSMIWKGFLANLKGLVYWSKGEIEPAIFSLKQGLKISQELGSEKHSYYTCLIMGVIYQSQGLLDSSLDFLHQSFEIAQQTGDVTQLLYSVNAIGVVYHSKGEYNLALDYFEQVLDIHKEFENDQYISYSYDFIGLTYFGKGELDESLDYLNRALQLRYDIGNDTETSYTIYNIILVLLEMKLLEEARKFLLELHVVSERAETRSATLRDKLATALVLKENSRASKKVEAQKILENIINETQVNFDLTVSAMINLTDLLLWELKSSGEREILDEIVNLLAELESIAEGRNSISLLIESLILQAKLAFIDLQVEIAEQLLDKALRLSKVHNIPKLIHKVNIEKNQLMDQIKIWQDVATESSSFVNRLNQTSIIDYMKSIKHTLDFPNY